MCVRTHVHVCTCVRVYVHVSACVHVCVHVRMCVCTCVCVRMCACVRVYSCVSIWGVGVGSSPCNPPPSIPSGLLG